MAAETTVEPPQSGLAGAAKVLVNAGKLSARSAEELQKSAKARNSSFVSAVVAAGAVSAADLAHTLSGALALPLMDLNAVDLQRLPRNIIDPKVASQYQLLVLGKRGNRLFIGAADPTDQEAAERIKFFAQMNPEWVIVEQDKLEKALDGQGTPVNEVLESMAGGEFEFDVTDEESAAQESDLSTEVEDAPVVRFLQKMLIDAINLRASDLHFEPYEYHYRVRFRVDGELREITQPPVAIKDKLGFAHQGHFAPGHRRKARAAGRQDEAEVRQQGDRLPRQHLAHAVRREGRDPHPGPVQRQAGHRCAGLREDREGSPALGHRPALRHDPGDRAHGQRQDGVALHLPEHPQPAGRQHRDRRGPGGNQPAGHQPGQRQRQGGPYLCRRAQVLPAPGPRHHHGRRDPRRRDRRHRDQGCADRPPGDVHAAHQRRPQDPDA
jgi:hypothetical protein